MEELLRAHPILAIVGLTAVIFLLRVAGLSRNWITGISITVVLAAAIYVARTNA